MNKPSTPITDCPVRNVISRIGTKWSVLVLCTLEKHDTLRFSSLQKAIGYDISQKMLTSTLHTLMQDGLISRRVYPEVPPRVEYALTQRAQTLLPHINALVTWAIENMDDIMNDREKTKF